MFKILYISLAFASLVASTTKAITPGLAHRYTQPVNFDKGGIEQFFSDFNQTQYGSFGLPAYLQHPCSFLSHIERVKNKHEYTLSVIDLFHTKLKESRWINPYALAQLLDTIATHCAPLCQSAVDTTAAAVKKSLYAALLTKFKQLQQDPELFMENLTDELLGIFAQDTHHRRIELQLAITRFVESALEKVIWNPQEQEDCWNSCNLLAEQLTTLHRLHIIPHETALNQCYWSLVYRFCYLIETAGDALSTTTYTYIMHELAAKKAPWILSEEQEPLMLAKLKRLQIALFEGEVKSRATGAGLWYN